MTKVAIDYLGKFKIVAFLVTVILVFFYNHLPQRHLQLIPSPSNLKVEITDQVVGGNSEIDWIDKAENHWACIFKDQYAYPYCNITFTWSEAPYTQIDFSPYSHLKIDLAYQGQADYLRIFIRNHYPHPNEPDPVQSGKFNTVTVNSTVFEQEANIYFNALRVSDWWINDYSIPPQDVTPDVSATIAFGIDVPYPAPLGRHEFELKSVTAVGHYFSKELVYFSVIVFWSVLLIGEMLVKYLRLNKQSKKYGKMISQMSEENALYKEKAETDNLTGILNREGLAQITEQLNAQSKLGQYAIIVLDIDHFKQINDTYGHDVGDSVIKDVAYIISSRMRTYDVVARWGGEEFVILFHCLSDKVLNSFSEKIRKAIESATFSNGIQGFVTASLGVCKLGNPPDFEKAFKRADEALYAAKQSGRNRCVVKG